MKRQPKTSGGEAPFTRESALSAVPIAPGVKERHPLENGGVRVVVAVPTSPLQRKILRLPETVQRDFELDAIGREILEQCDGKTTVADMLAGFSRKHGISRIEGDKAVLTFIRTLVSKGIIILTIPKL